VDPWGNQVLRIEVGTLPPYASRVLTIDAHVGLSDAPRKVEADRGELRAFTQAERFIESDHALRREIAGTLKSSDAQETAQRTYHYVRQSLSRTGFTPEDRGALRALADKAGDCTEHAYLLAALLRANGIPARVMGGYLMAESGVLRAEDYHNWAEFYANGAWRLADAHQGNFGRNASRYIATRVMSATTGIGTAHRYAAHGTGLKVTMN
jgi:transglutaminase-like putative cysteine protease